jgi:nucleotide-binding universal stress UspA family protein
MKRIRTILHPTDFSPGSKVAFEYACDLARDYDARLVVLHAFGPAVPIGSEGVILSEDVDELRGFAQKELQELRPTNPTLRIEHVLREGPTVNTVVETARELAADLIVMGTHGHTGFRRLILGSVAEEVLRHAPCPVLTVKEQRPSDQEKPSPKSAAAT